MSAPGKHSALYPYPFEPHDSFAEEQYRIGVELFTEVKPFLIAWADEALGTP